METQLLLEDGGRWLCWYNPGQRYAQSWLEFELVMNCSHGCRNTPTTLYHSLRWKNSTESAARKSMRTTSNAYPTSPWLGRTGAAKKWLPTTKQMFRKHSWGEQKPSEQADRQTFLMTDFSALVYSLSQFPVSGLNFLSCGAESEKGPLLRPSVTWHAEFHNTTQREKAARWPFHLFHLALTWHPPLRCPLVIYVVAIGKTDITCSWQCTTSKLSYSGDGSNFFPPYHMKTSMESNKNNLSPRHFKQTLSSFCHSSHELKAAYT